MRDGKPNTENEEFRRRIKHRAIATTYRYLREKFPEEWGQIKYETASEIRRSGEEVSRSVRYYRAIRRLRDAHRTEYDLMLMLFNEQLQQEHGYEPQTHKGHANLVPNRRKAVAEDAAAHVA